MLKGLSLNVEGRGQDRRGAKKVYTFGHVENEDNAEQLTGKTDEAGKTAWRSWPDRAEQIAGKADADGKEVGRGRSERWGKNGKHNREREGGGGRKKLMSMKIIG